MREDDVATGIGYLADFEFGKDSLHADKEIIHHHRRYAVGGFLQSETRFKGSVARPVVALYLVGEHLCQRLQYAVDGGVARVPILCMCCL